MVDFIGYNVSLGLFEADDALEATYDTVFMHSMISMVFARIVAGCKGFSKEKVNKSTKTRGDQIGVRTLAKNDLIVELFGFEIGIGETKRVMNGTEADFEKGARAMRDMFEVQVLPKLGLGDNIGDFMFFFVQLEKCKLHFHVATKTHLHFVQMEELLTFEVPLRVNDFLDTEKMQAFLQGVIGIHRIAYLYQCKLSNALSALRNKPVLSPVDTTSQTPRKPDDDTDRKDGRGRRGHPPRGPDPDGGGRDQGGSDQGGDGRGFGNGTGGPTDQFNFSMKASDFEFGEDENTPFSNKKAFSIYNCLRREKGELLARQCSDRHVLSQCKEWYDGQGALDSYVVRTQVVRSAEDYQSTLLMGKEYVLKQYCTTHPDLEKMVVEEMNQEYRMHCLAQRAAPGYVIPAVAAYHCDPARRQSQIMWWADEKEHSCVTVLVMEVGGEWRWMAKRLVDWLWGMMDLARGLSLLHGHGLVHGDVKYSNVLEYGGRVVLCDFGHAEDLTELSSVFTGTFGTDGFRRPWCQASQRRSISPMDDVYSFGCMLCYGLAIHVEYEHQDEIQKDRELRRVVEDGAHRTLLHMEGNAAFVPFGDLIELCQELVRDDSSWCMINVRAKLARILRRLDDTAVSVNTDGSAIQPLGELSDAAKVGWPSKDSIEGRESEHQAPLKGCPEAQLLSEGCAADENNAGLAPNSKSLHPGARRRRPLRLLSDLNQ